MGDKGVLGGEDIGEGMQCSDHPYRTNPGGICACCLQEKLGKLVTSSKSNPFFPLPPHPSSSSSSPSFRSDFGGFGPVISSSVGGGTSGASRTSACAGGGRTKIPFLSANNRKKKSSNGSGYNYNNSGRKVVASSVTATSAAANNHNVLALKRSKSVAPRPVGGLTEGGGIAEDSPRKKSFWSFLYISSSSASSTTTTTTASSASNKRRSTSSSSGYGTVGTGGGDCGSRDLNLKAGDQGPVSSDSLGGQADSSKETPKSEHQGVAAPAAAGDKQLEVVESPGGRSQASSSSFGRKVARSRSVGCGSRSFSGDFLERISNGFGDCTLRRVESQREAKPNNLHHHDADDDQQRIKERVKCGGIFGGFGIISSSSSSSSYWLSAAAAAADDHDFGSTATTTSSRMSSTSRDRATAVACAGGTTPHGRSRSWGWAFSSPMRAFRPASSAKSYAITSINSTTTISGGNSSSNNSKIVIGGGSKLGHNPSLLAVRG